MRPNLASRARARTCLSLLLLLQGMGSRLDPPAFRPPKFHGFSEGVKGCM